mmetsp:Transcript_14349/g.21195  ORF Transcript_14349/g.21195 Transcript_14349/m.21195 type:complete len:479 (-) Transcript_14349:275-1711(-)
MQDYSSESFEDDSDQSIDAPPQQTEKSPLNSTDRNTVSTQRLLYSGKKYLGEASSKIPQEQLQNGQRKISAIDFSSFDPRKKRINSILNQRKFSIHSFYIFELKQISEYEIYRNRLSICPCMPVQHEKVQDETTTMNDRDITHTICEVSCQCNDDNRNIYVQTERINTEMKESQCRNGEDDTAFQTKLSQCQSQQYSDLQESLFSSNLSYSLDTVRLEKFLRRITPVFEAFFEEMIWTRSTSQLSSDTLFSTPGWDTFGCPEQSENEVGLLLGGREITGLTCSTSREAMIVSMHPPSVHNNTFLGPKGIICVWHVNANASKLPAHILVIDDPCVCPCICALGECMISGSDDGTMHLWDLREASRQMNLYSTTNSNDLHTLLKKMKGACHHVNSITFDPEESEPHDCAISDMCRIPHDNAADKVSAWNIASIDVTLKVIIWYVYSVSSWSKCRNISIDLTSHNALFSSFMMYFNIKVCD